MHAPNRIRRRTMRHPGNISLGDGVIVDDNTELDTHGAGPGGVVAGDHTILSRNVSVKAKIGPVHIGRECDIGARSDLHRQGGLFIGHRVTLGGSAKISGGIFQIDRTADPNMTKEQADDREQERSTAGPIRIEDKCFIGMGSMFLDGVTVDEGSVVGAGSVVNKDVPRYTVAAGVPAKTLRERPHYAHSAQR